MDIHKPKAAHSWREFLIEIGTIIFGILIALGLEQIVEAVHRHAEVREAREALHTEVGHDMAKAEVALRMGACDLRYLSKYVEWAHGGPQPPPDHRNYPFANASVWDVSRAAVAMMPLNERKAFAAFYFTVNDYNTMVDRQRTLALRIGEATGLDHLSEGSREELLKAITSYRSASLVVDQIGRSLVTQGEATGAHMESLAAVRSNIDQVCGLADRLTPPA